MARLHAPSERHPRASLASPRAVRAAAAVLFAWLVASCGEPDPPPPSPFPYVPEKGTPERVAYDTGLTRYLGMAPPIETVSDASGVTTFTFDPADGPMCLRGASYRASTRETASPELLVFLQGGGACWSDFCLAITTAREGIPEIDLLRDAGSNPLAGWDVLYLPYCDGSLFAGDNDLDDDGDGALDRFHRGLHNLSAALTVGRERFPAPTRVVLAGSSGGGFGTILATALVRYVWPGVPLFVLNDAGVGVARPGDTAFVDQLLDEFGATDFIPADCTGCLGDGHITGLIQYALDHDPDLRIAAFSSLEDLVVGEIFLGLTPADFRAALESETAALHAAYPDRYRRYLYAGNGHTVLLGDVSGIIGADLGSVEIPMEVLSRIGEIRIESMYVMTIDGVTPAAWLGGLLAGDLDVWADLVAP